MAEVRASFTNSAKSSDQDLVGVPHLGGTALSTTQRFLTICERILARDAADCKHFETGILRKFVQPQYHNFFRKAGTASAPDTTNATHLKHVLKIWCMSASVAFREIFEEAHSVIITSGTLSPLDSFAAELCHRLSVRLEAPHVIDKNRQLWIGNLGRGPQGVSLMSTYTNTGSFAYQDSLGSTILCHLQQVPGGVLCFFPSYTLLQKCIARWKTTKLLSRIRQWKTVVIEPRRTGCVQSVRLMWWCLLHFLSLIL